MHISDKIDVDIINIVRANVYFFRNTAYVIDRYIGYLKYRYMVLLEMSSREEEESARVLRAANHSTRVNKDETM